MLPLGAGLWGQSTPVQEPAWEEFLSIPTSLFAHLQNKERTGKRKGAASTNSARVRGSILKRGVGPGSVVEHCSRGCRCGSAGGLAVCTHKFWMCSSLNHTKRVDKGVPGLGARRE